MSTAMDDTFIPLPWSLRTATVPTLPGSSLRWADTLRTLLERLARPSEAADVLDDVAKLLEVRRETARRTLSGLARAGVLRRAGASFAPSEAARRWQTEGDPAVLIGTLHTHVRYVGELMETLTRQPAGHEELRRDAGERFALPWDSAGPVRDRTNWLRALRLADLFDGRVHLTAEGKRAQSLLVPGTAPVEGEEPAELPEPPAAVAALLAGLDTRALENRARAAALYVPGGQDGDGRLEALRLLTEAAMPRLTDDAFTRLVLDEFPGTSRVSSARTARDTVKQLGLIRRVSSTAWAATEAGADWVATDQAVDLARIVHAHVFYFAEILHDLDGCVPPTAAGLAERAAARTGAGGRTPTPAAVKARLDLLLACGLVTKTTHTAYAVTALGRAFRDTVPCLPAPEPARSAAAAVPGPASPARAGRAEALASELEAAALHGGDHERLERAAVEALGHLGMPGEWIGGTGHADGRVRHGVGARSRVLAVEAKASSSGRVTEQHLYGLPEHRAEIGADITLLIGPGFDRRLLRAADDDPAIAVVLTGLLAEAVRAQELTPLTPTELEPLVDPGLRADQRADHLRRAWQAQRDRARLERTLVDILIKEAEDPLQEGGWLDVAAVRRELRGSGVRATEAEVTDALAFLACPRVAVVERSGHGYRAVAAADTARQRMSGLGRQWDVSPSA